MYNIELTQQSNVTAYHSSYYYPILWTRKLRPTPHSVRESHKDTLLVRVGALVQTQVYLTPKPGPFPPSRASMWLVTCSFLDCFMKGSLIFSTKPSARTMLPVSFEHAWHRTGSWEDAQKNVCWGYSSIEKRLVTAQNCECGSTQDEPTLDKIAQVMTCAWIPSHGRKWVLASLIALGSSVQELGLKRTAPQL